MIQFCGITCVQQMKKIILLSVIDSTSGKKGLYCYNLMQYDTEPSFTSKHYRLTMYTHRHVWVLTGMIPQETCKPSKKERIPS